MRARSGVNFREEDLPEIARRCRERGAKAYLALNAIMFEDETGAVERTIIAAKPFVDAFIVSDWGVISLCRRHGAVFHVSTQMSTSNSGAVRFLASQGAARVVLARECTLSEVSRIAAAVPSVSTSGRQLPRLTCKSCAEMPIAVSSKAAARTTFCKKDTMVSKF